MKLLITSPWQISITVLILTAGIAFTVIYIHYIQCSAAERAIQAKSPAGLTIVLDKHPELLNRPNKKNGFTPLHLAVMANQTNMVELLLARGAALDAADRYGLTPLHKAAAFNRLEFARMLMDNGADPQAFGLKYGLIRVAPIHLAAEAGFTGMVRLFLDQGVDINLRTQGKNQVTGLHMAAAKGQAEVVELLLKAGADVNARDAAGKTPLHWARIADQEEVAGMLKIYDGIE